MMKLYKSEVKPYIAVLVVTMVLCALFIVSADNNAKSEQTYKMTDHQITQDTAKHERNQPTSEGKSEHIEQALIAAAHQ